ncbi:hypothetical protein K438DRAFT_1988410 [Mycena galopus ATCC 62051]|nr:hypothetical protein K438DRAFT_1988410 [Mycena galopus ATCC 62051]
MASKSTPSTDGPVTLHFHDITRVAGETITGRIDLNVALAQEDNLEHLRIKCKGTIRCMVIHPPPLFDSYTFQYKNFSLDQGTAFPEPGSHILPLPFQFLLPTNLPPSFHCAAYHRSATISYAIEVTGERAGFYRINRRIRRLISVVPAASQSQLIIQESLRQGWNGPWKDFTQEEKLRQGIWGDYSRARLTIPKLDSYPIATAIPFSFHVETETKPMPISHASGPVDKHGRPLFPALPALSSDVRLAIHRRAEIRVRRYTRHVEDDFDLKGSLGDVTQVAAIHQVSDEPEWIPASGPKDKKGHEILDWQYNLLFVVPFPGIGNNLRLEIPLHLHPGSACPPPPIGAPGSSSMTYADVLPAGPPPMLDLPPSYWTGEHHVWDADEKS